VPDSIAGIVIAYLLGSLAFAIGGYVLIGDELRESLARLRHAGRANEPRIAPRTGR